MHGCPALQAVGAFAPELLPAPRPGLRLSGRPGFALPLASPPQPGSAANESAAAGGSSMAAVVLSVTAAPAVSGALPTDMLWPKHGVVL